MRPKLEYGSSGPAVVELQMKLNALIPDQPPLKVDGKYADKSIARVKQFQKKRGLVPDGVVGAKTWAAIDGLPTPASSTTEHPAAPKSAHQQGLKAYSGAAVKCDCGTVRSVLLLTSGAAATAGDSKAYVNILPFGQCTSRGHPLYFDPDTYADPLMGVEFELYKGNQRPVCTPVITSPWTGHFTGWGVINEAQTIDKSARCTCRFGGTIRFV
jgi:hypothetical protein